MSRAVTSILALAIAGAAFTQSAPEGIVQASAPMVPRVIKFGGVIGDAKGNTHVIFALYKEQIGGTPLWDEGQEVTFDEKGAYNIFLGSNHQAGLPTDMFASGEARWLGVQVDGRPEEKRVLLVSVPYALKAGDADTIGGMPLSAFLLAGDKTGVGSDGLNYVNTKDASAFVVATKASVTKTAAAAVVTSAGTLNRVAKFDASGNVLNSTIFDNGKVGIGTITPQRTLDVSATGQITFGNNGVATTGTTGLFWTSSDTAFGLFKTPGSWVTPNYQQLAMKWPTGVVIDGGTVNGKSGTVLQPNGGKVGIGTSAPTQALDVVGVIQSSGAIVANNGVVGHVTVASTPGVQGTSSTSDGVYGLSTVSSGNGVRGAANVGTNAYGVFGTSSTGYGVVGSGVTGGRFTSFSGIALEAEVNSIRTMSVDASGVHAGPGMTGTPVAYGAFEFDGTKLGGSANISCSWNAASTRYDVVMTGETFTPSTHVAMVTPSNTNGASTFANTSWDGGSTLVVRVWTVGAGTITKGQGSFHIVVYKL